MPTQESDAQHDTYPLYCTNARHPTWIYVRPGFGLQGAANVAFVRVPHAAARHPLAVWPLVDRRLRRSAPGCGMMIQCEMD